MSEDQEDAARIMAKYREVLEMAQNVEPRGLEEFSNSDRMGEVLQAVSKPAKLEVFLKLFHGLEPNRIKDEVDVSGSTVHNYVKDLVDADLVENTSEGYSVTWQGEFVVYLLEMLSTMLKAEQVEALYEVADLEEAEQFDPEGHAGFSDLEE